MPSTIPHQYAGPTSGARSCSRLSRSSGGAPDVSGDSADRWRVGALTRWRVASPLQGARAVTTLSNAMDPTGPERANAPTRQRANAGSVAIRFISGCFAVPFLLGV